LQYRFRNGSFYVFYDRYQAIQGEMDIRWLEQIPCRLVLSRNCRNTDPIARVAYRARGLPVALTLGLAGPRPVLHTPIDNVEAVKIVSSLVEIACAKHKIAPHEVAVLTLETLEEGSPWRLAQIGNQRTADEPQPNCAATPRFSRRSMAPRPWASSIWSASVTAISSPLPKARVQQSEAVIAFASATQFAWDYHPELAPLPRLGGAGICPSTFC
jgi:hypothetical protein